MPDKEKENKKKPKKEIKKPEASVEITYIQEETPKEIILAHDEPYNAEITINGNSFEAHIGSGVGNVLDYEALRNSYKSGQITINEVYDCITNTIKENKNNPATLGSVVDTLLYNFQKLYDNELNSENIGNTPVEQLKTILSVPDGYELSGFVCAGIHEVVMNLLQDCGINAVVLCGKTPDGRGHATLLYQNSDGDYILNNYESTYTIKGASNIKEAALAVYKNSGIINDMLGYLDLRDKNGSYKEFVLKDESAFGYELDKRDYNSIGVFNHSIVPKSSISASMYKSNLDNMGIELKGILKRGEHKDGSISIAYKQGSESFLYQNYKSTGIKYETNRIHDRFFIHNKFIFAKTEGTVCPTWKNTDTAMQQYQNVQEELNLWYQGITNDPNCGYFIDYMNTNNSKPFKNTTSTYFYRGEAGFVQKLKNTDTVGINNVCQGSLMVEANDYRIALEDGISLSKKSEKDIFDVGISAGAIWDLKNTLGDQARQVTPGFKLNAEAQYIRNLDKSTSVYAANNAYITNTQTSTDYGIGLSAGVKKDINNNISVLAQAGINYENQRLKIGEFNENTENKLKTGSSVGVQFKNNTTIKIGYSNNTDFINSTRNKNYFTVGLNMNF